MDSNYDIFDILHYPVAVSDNEHTLIYANNAFKKLYAAGCLHDFQNSSEEKRLFICSDKGEIRCFKADVSDSIGVRVWSFTDVTGLINRKSMIETASIDEKHITKQNLRKIIEKNKRLSEVVDSMDSGVMIEGSSGNVIQLNKSFLKIISGQDGFSIAEDYDASDCHARLAELVLSHDYFRIKDAIVAGHQHRSFTDEITLKDGRVFVRTYNPLFIGGVAKGCMWKFKDITLKKQMETFRSELEAVISALEASEAVGLFLDFKGFTFVNKGMLHLLETDRETFKAKGLGAYIEGRIFPEDGNVIERIVPVKKSDGRECMALIISDEVRIGSDNVVVVSMRDITEQVHLQNSLRENEEKFRTIFEDNSAFMLIFDPSTMDILDCNASVAGFYGYATEEMRHKKMCDLTKSCSQVECRILVENILSNGTGARLPVKAVITDGSERDVELKLTPISLNGQTVLFVIMEDISDRVKYQAQLETINKDLKGMVSEEIEKRRKNEELLMEKMRLAEIGEMIGSIAHQWRQPLNTLGLLIQDISDANDFGELSDNYVTDFVKDGMKQIDFMSKTIDDFRDFFKPSKKTEIFDVKDAVSQVLSIIKPQLRNKSIECVVVCSCGRRERVESDTDELSKCSDHNMRIHGFQNEFKQVLLNLISNARDAMISRPVKILKIRLSSDDRYVTVTVQDTGGGIPMELMDRIFEPYFTTKGDKGGTGIGLYMSKAIIEENMKGSLSVQNTNEGCRFTITMDKVTD